jgi:hypothetical protein
MRGCLKTPPQGRNWPSGPFRAVVQVMAATELCDASPVSGWTGEVFKHPLRHCIRSETCPRRTVSGRIHGRGFWFADVHERPEHRALGVSSIGDTSSAKPHARPPPSRWHDFCSEV